MPKRKKFNAADLPFLGPRQPTHARCPALLKPGPGPGAYRDMRTFGSLSTTNLAVTQYRTGGAACFGQSRRDQGPNSLWVKTPSQGPIYRIESSIGKQTRSQRRNHGAVDFGTSVRDAYDKTYIARSRLKYEKTGFPGFSDPPPDVRH